MPFLYVFVVSVLFLFLFSSLAVLDLTAVLGNCRSLRRGRGWVAVSCRVQTCTISGLCLMGAHARDVQPPSLPFLTGVDCSFPASDYFCGVFDLRQASGERGMLKSPT